MGRLSRRERKGITLGFFWGFFAWLPYFHHTSPLIRYTVGFPVLLGQAIRDIVALFSAEVAGKLSPLLLAIPCGAAFGYFLAAAIGKGSHGRKERLGG